MGWGRNSIPSNLFEYIVKYLPEGKTILELGSGWGTSQLIKHWNVWSIENSPAYIGLYHDQYIEAPLKRHKKIGDHPGNTWYDPVAVKEGLKGVEYDLILIDGPSDNRAGFIQNLDLFKHDVPMVFDDMGREKHKSIIEEVADMVGSPYKLHFRREDDIFGVVNEHLFVSSE